MVSMTLALLTVLPAGRALVADAARLAAPAKDVAAADTPTAPTLALPAPAPMLALPAPRRSSLLLAAIEDHRSANLAMSQAVRDYVRAQDDSAPDEALMLAIASRASDVEAEAFHALMAFTPADAEETGILTAYFAEVSAELDKEAFGTQLLQRLAIMLAQAKAA